MFKFLRKPVNTNVEREAHKHFMIGLTAYASEQIERDKGTIAAPHLFKIADRHFRLQAFFDSLLEVYENATKRNQ